MPIEVRWLVDPSVSAFHAAEAAARGIPLADAELADALAAPLGELPDQAMRLLELGPPLVLLGADVQPVEAGSRPCDLDPALRVGHFAHGRADVVDHVRRVVDIFVQLHRQNGVRAVKEILFQDR